MSDRIIYSPRNGDEVIRASPPGTKIFLYSDLSKDMSLSTAEVFARFGRNNIILLQDPKKMNSGHWIALSFNPRKKEAFFFSSYGGMPDREKMDWIRGKDLKRSGQLRNILNDGLKQLAREGWVIHYNDHQYQKPGDKTATCGIWAAAFLQSRQNPDDFYAEHKTPLFYYQKYFANE